MKLPAKTKTSPLVVPVILCGGSGTRLWPASREDLPKQFLSLTNDLSLLQNTMRRALRVSGAPASQLVVVTLGAMKDKVVEQLNEIDKDATLHILSEPSARNTAAAVALAAEYVARTFGRDAIMWILPADHHIEKEEMLGSAYAKAIIAAQNRKLVTFGITPTRPDTGYGYIRSNGVENASGIFDVAEFVEKPDLDTAKSYVKSGQYMWNSGMFLFGVDRILSEYETLCPYITDGVRIAMTDSLTEPFAPAYARIAKEPFDKAIMEKSHEVCVVPCNPGWSDIGSWESLWEIRTKDKNNNFIEGRATAYNSEGCFVMGQDRLIAIAGLNDLVVIETKDSVLIAHKKDGESMRELVAALKASGAAEISEMPSETPSHSWVMEKSISREGPLQAHEKILKPAEEKSFDTASGVITVIEGTATILANGETKTLSSYQSLRTESGNRLVIANRGTSDLKMIVVRQTQPEIIVFGAHRKTA